MLRRWRKGRECVGRQGKGRRSEMGGKCVFVKIERRRGGKGRWKGSKICAFWRLKEGERERKCREERKSVSKEDCSPCLSEVKVRVKFVYGSR